MIEAPTAWRTTPLGEVIRHRKEFIQISDLETYKRCRVQLHAKGVVLRDKVKGAAIKTKKQQVCREGEFLVAEIDAKLGGFGIVPEELEGAIVSSHYFLYRIDEAKLDRSFLDFYIRTPAFRDQVSAQGSTNYAAIRPHHVLEYTVPLPPLPEQRRIVAKIQQLVERVEEARELREESVKRAKSFMDAARVGIFQNLMSDETIPFNEVARLERGKFSHRPRNDPRFFGGEHPWIQIGEIESSGKYIRNWTKTLNDEGLSISRKFPQGTVLISIAATIGAVGILGFDCCIPDSIVAITPKEASAESEYIYHYLCYLRNDLESIAPQSAQKNINLKILSPFPFPKTELKKQSSIIAYLDDLQTKVDDLECLQTDTQRELNALLPSILDKAFKGEL